MIGGRIDAGSERKGEQSDAILRGLRAPGETGYKIPTGGLYRWVSSPNYLGEILFWWGLSLFGLAASGPRWWLAVGAAIGFGMLSKYSMPFLLTGLGLGVLSGDLRAHLRSKWLWSGAALSIVIFLPNLLWQWRHDFISLQFLQHIHARDVRIGRTKDFLPDQLELMSFALPIAASGLFFFFSKHGGRRFRVLGWMFVVPFAEEVHRMKRHAVSPSGL